MHFARQRKWFRIRTHYSWIWFSLSFFIFFFSARSCFLRNFSHFRVALSSTNFPSRHFNFWALSRIASCFQKLQKILPIIVRKAGRVWCLGARETHWAMCHNEVTVSKTKQCLKSPCFSRFLWYNNFHHRIKYKLCF